MNEVLSPLCRICLKECDGSQSVFNFLKKERCSDLIKRFTGIEIVQNENHPSSMCKNCTTRLCVMVKFVKKFHYTTKKIDHAANMKLQNTDVKVNEIFDAKDVGMGILDEEENSNDHYTTVIAESFGLKKNMIRCLTCGITVQNKSAFLVHYRKHSGEKPCVCPHCGRGFTQSGSLNEHIKRQHEGGKLAGYKYTCETCGKQFWRRGALTVHTRIHTKEKPYQCSYCPKAFAQFSEHLLHTRTHTGQRPHPCPLCSKAFISHSALKRHQIVHEGDRKYSCHICQSSLKSKESLKKHVLVMHTAEKKNVCDMCGAKFSLKYNLKSHIKLRHSEKSGNCTVCNKTFSNLNKHLCTHTADTLLCCFICNRKFLREKALQLHMAKYHADNSTFNCSFNDCLETFTKQSKLSLHISRCHSNVCQFCCRGFSRAADLKNHIKSNHDSSENAVSSSDGNINNSSQNIVESSTNIISIQ